MKNNAWGPLTLLLLIALIVCGIWIDKTPGFNLRAEWIVVMAIFIALCIGAGILVNGRAEGILIDDRNRISLERVQWVAWLIVLLAGYFVEAIWNIRHSGSFPQMQAELFILLGIVNTSPVVSNLIVDTKKRSPLAPAAGPVAAGDSPGQKGAMDVNRSSDEASWADLYLGEEAANRYVVDISRLQKLIITVLLVFTYATYLWIRLNPNQAVSIDMPSVDQTFLGLAGVSHGAYLAYKATPKTPS